MTIEKYESCPLCEAPYTTQGEYDFQVCNNCDPIPTIEQIESDDYCTAQVAAMAKQIAEMQRRIEDLETPLRVNDDYITALKAGQEWISVDDALPSKAASQRVLVYSPERGVEHGYWSGDYFHGECDDVTHWMPLPEPPAQQGEESE